jgi:hypothetical protein
LETDKVSYAYDFAYASSCEYSCGWQGFGYCYGEWSYADEIIDEALFLSTCP